MAYLDGVLTEVNFHNQVDVVAQERSQRMDNVPYGTVFEQILPLVFDPAHPYGHLPIGNMQHLAEATLDEVSAFHRRYYMPNNAVLSIVGDVTADEALGQAERFFGHIAAGEAPPRDIPATLSPVDADGRIDLVDDVPAPAIWFAIRLPADAPDARDLAAAVLATSILGEGETSRLHRRLVRKDKVALSASFGVNTLIAGNSLGAASVRAVPGQDLDVVAASFAELLAEFVADGPTDAELAIARAQAERDWLDEMGTAAGRADAISGCALLFGDPETVNLRLPLIASITASEVQEAAATWLLPAMRAQARVHPSAEEEAA